MFILSCDPGLTGALALIDTRSGALLECADIPSCANGTTTGSMKKWCDSLAVEALLAGWSLDRRFAEESVAAVIERPIPMPSLPAQTIASQFDTFGVLRTVMDNYSQISLECVNPSTWKKFFGFGSDKAQALEIVNRLYPGTHYFKRQKDHNRAEAVLIGHWYKALKA